MALMKLTVLQAVQMAILTVMVTVQSVSLDLTTVMVHLNTVTQVGVLTVLMEQMRVLKSVVTKMSVLQLK